MTDTELVASILAGDLRALEALMRRHKGILLRTARAILRDDAEAEDAVQEAWVQAYRALGTFRGEAKLSTWLARIAANASLMRRRGSARDAHLEIDEETIASSIASPDSDAASRQIRMRLEEQIEALPTVYRAVFRLRALEERTVEETAAALGIPQATVRTRYFRARNLLREALAEERLQRASLPSLVISERDLGRLISLRPHAALLRELERAEVVASQFAPVLDAVTMNCQVSYTDEASGAQRRINLVYPHEAAGCACCVSILAPVGTALIGLRTGHAIEWDFGHGGRRRLRVDEVIHANCPLNAATA